MNVEFTTTELITDEEILSAFGESIRFDEGKFKIDSFIDCLEDRADVMGLCITEKSKKELLQHLKELVIKLVSIVLIRHSMLNENLMDSKDIIIAKLKLAIKEFQEYDIERKKYYSNALVELGKLKDEIEELRGINKYSKSYIAMKDENRRLKASLARKGIKELTDFYDVKNVELIIQNQTLKGENRKLRARNSELIKNNKMLINKLNKYEQLLNYIWCS